MIHGSHSLHSVLSLGLFTKIMLHMLRYKQIMASMNH